MREGELALGRPTWPPNNFTWSCGPSAALPAHPWDLAFAATSGTSPGEGVTRCPCVVDAGKESSTGLGVSGKHGTVGGRVSERVRGPWMSPKGGKLD